jgi:hypothetical protein
MMTNEIAMETNTSPIHRVLRDATSQPHFFTRKLALWCRLADYSTHTQKPCDSSSVIAQQSLRNLQVSDFSVSSLVSTDLVSPATVGREEKYQPATLQ